MKIRSINAEKMGLSNRLTLLNLIRTTPGISRRELARSAGLDPSTVTKIISALLEKGLVEESGLRTAVSPGRKSVMLTVAREGAAANWLLVFPNCIMTTEEAPKFDMQNLKPFPFGTCH